jgi:hypothetical protein
MREYDIIATIVQTRSYRVLAEDAAVAKEILRGEFEFLEYDIIDAEVEDVSVEDYNA